MRLRIPYHGTVLSSFRPGTINLCRKSRIKNPKSSEGKMKEKKSQLWEVKRESLRDLAALYDRWRLMVVLPPIYNLQVGVIEKKT